MVPEYQIDAKYDKSSGTSKFLVRFKIFVAVITKILSSVKH
jgi:hypothetical protein